MTNTEQADKFLALLLPKIEDVLAEKPEADRELYRGAIEEGVRQAAAHGAFDYKARAMRELADAFAKIEQYRDYIPAENYNAIADAITNWIASIDWLSEPARIRRVMPHILRDAIENEREEEKVAA